MAELATLDGIVGIRVERGVSVKPPGDVVSVDLTNPAQLLLMERLQKYRLGESDESSISSSEVLSSISWPSAGLLTRERTESTWEEMESSLLKESNTTANTVLLMFCAGAIAAIGVSTNALHVVIGAMLIAPGFEPISRIGLGVVANSHAWRRGLSDLVRLYLVLMVGAATATLMFMAMGVYPLSSQPGYLGEGQLLRYWTTVNLTSTVVSVLSAIAGAVLISTNRSVLTAGVMTGLALVPAMTITVMALMLGDWTTSGQAFLRWLVDVCTVLVFALVVFAWKRRFVQRRARMLL
ncbi:DUF389 domain-containing protein [Stutzerimonas urumqiensis]|uniref:DUF389 domain-containing protein n=1 Tax=Stutzerimonas urumqiensis TaxID=638269 RepID=UPI003BA87A3B